MQVGISNIGWPIDKIDVYKDFALAAGFHYIESAYTKMPSNRENIFAIQSIFYGSGIDTFAETEKLQEFFASLTRNLNQELQVITVGSPTMRKNNSQKSLLTALTKLADDIPNVKICIEPIAKKYCGEYYHNVVEILSDLPPNIHTMIDTGNLLLEGVDCFSTFEMHQGRIKHVHFSTMDLKEIRDFGFYKEFFQHLKQHNYQGLVTYELNQADNVEKCMDDFIFKICNS